MTVAVELPNIQLRAIRPQGWATQAGRAVVRGPVLLGAAGTLAGQQLLVRVHADDAATGGVGAASGYAGDSRRTGDRSAPSQTRQYSG
jgi:hypothetical protein